LVPASPIFVIVGVILYTFVGTVAGALTGLVAALILKKPKARGILKDGVRGAVGFLVTFLIASLISFPTNTVTYHVHSTLVTSTENSYQHPFTVALVAAIVLPLIREVYSLKHS
jgi:uncharacterized membrane protein YeaQ/YmgE (transglycosylase-associated protein family)